MTDEGSRPDFGLTKSNSRTAKRINSRGLDEATRLRWRGVVSALDEVLKALDRDLALLGSKLHLDLANQPGLRLTLNAVKVAAVYVQSVGLMEDANLLRVEGDRYFRVFTDLLFSGMAKGKSEDEVHGLKQLYGEFPTPPTNPEEVGRFFFRQEGKCRHHGDVVRRHVKRIQGMLTKGFAAGNDPPGDGGGNDKVENDAMQKLTEKVDAIDKRTKTKPTKKEKEYEVRRKFIRSRRDKKSWPEIAADWQAKPPHKWEAEYLADAMRHFWRRYGDEQTDETDK